MKTMILLLYLLGSTQSLPAGSIGKLESTWPGSFYLNAEKLMKKDLFLQGLRELAGILVDGSAVHRITLDTAQPCFGTSNKTGSRSGNSSKPTAAKSGLPLFKSNTAYTDDHTGRRSAAAKSSCRAGAWYPDPPTDPGGIEYTTATASPSMLPVIVAHLGAQGTILSSEELPMAPQIFTGLIFQPLFPGSILPNSQANPDAQNGILPAGQAGMNPAIQGTSEGFSPTPSDTDDDFEVTAPAGIRRGMHTTQETTTGPPNVEISKRFQFFFN
ncbi:amelotin isoform X1 [Prionailurus iriomotensis]